MSPSPTLFPRERGARRGFTLIELLTVIAIIGILAAIIIPTVGRVRDSARSTQCLSNLKQMGSAALLYVQDNKGKLMPLDHRFNKLLWPYAYSEAGAAVINITGNELPAVLAGTIFECPKAHADTSTTKRSYGVNQLLVPGSPVDVNNAKVVTYTKVTEPSRGALFADVLGTSGLNPTYVNARHNQRMNVVFVDGHAAAIQLTEAITNPGAFVTEPFWTGLQR